MYLKTLAALLILVNVITWIEASSESSQQQKSAEQKKLKQSYLNLLHSNEAASAKTANSEAIFTAISQLTEKRQSMIKRNLLKRIQVPFKWGKRSSEPAAATANPATSELDQCADLFIILLGPNRDQLTQYNRGELKSFFDLCFSMLIDNLFKQNAAIDAALQEDDQDDNTLDEVNSSSNSDMVTKRSNVPFKWGRK